MSGGPSRISRKRDDRLGKNVVNLRSCDAHIHKFADGRAALENHAAIHLRRIVFAPGDPRLIDKNANGLSLLCGGQLGGDSLLNLHRLPISAVLYFGWHLIRHLGGARTLLLRVAKYAKPLKASHLDEIKQTAEVLLRFTRKSDDEGGSNRQSGNADAEPANQILDMCPRCFPPHRAQHVGMNVLQRHIHIPRHFRVTSNRRDQLVTPVSRMGVEKANPKLSFDACKLIEQSDKSWSPPGIYRLARIPPSPAINPFQSKWYPD